MRALHSLAHLLPDTNSNISLAPGELQKRYVGQYVLRSHGVWHIFEREGKVTEQLLSTGSQLTPAAATDDRSSLSPTPANESAQLVLTPVSLAILGLAAAVVLSLVRRQCSTPYETVSSGVETARLPGMDDAPDSSLPEYL